MALYSSKELVCQCRRRKRRGFDPWFGKILSEEGVVIHSSVHVWRILWTEEPGELQSIGLQRVRHNRSELARTHIYVHLYVCVCVHIYMHVYIYVCVCVYVYILHKIYMYICGCMRERMSYVVWW